TFDGDGDRCLVADRHSIYDGDFILAAAASYLQSRGTLNKNKVVATTMSNLGLELFLKRREIELLRVPVGDRYVLGKLESENLSLGGEQSGHIIFMNDTFIGDGLITALQLLRISKAQGVSLAELCKDFEKCPQILLNIPVQRKPELTSIEEVRDGIDRIQQELNGSGRIVVRYSGTEMLARIMIEGKDQQYIEKAAKTLGEIIRRNLS
ncbi:MAG TPA: phosphoglucosamine mutase, partial [Acidobacteriota bacterium]